MPRQAKSENFAFYVFAFIIVALVALSVLRGRHGHLAEDDWPLPDETLHGYRPLNSTSP